MENSAPSLKIFALLNCGNKNRRQNPVREFTKTRLQSRFNIFIGLLDRAYEVLLANIKCNTKGGQKSYGGGLEPSMLL